MAYVNAFDSSNYPAAVPASVTRGDRWAWKLSSIASAYPSSAYTVKWIARLEADAATDNEITVTATASGLNYLFEVAAATTVGYHLGAYRWQLVVIRDSDSERVVIDTGRTTVEADQDDASGDHRSFARRALENLEAALVGNTSPDVVNYSISGRAIGRMSADERIRLRNYYRHCVAAEDRAALAAAGRPNGTRIRTRFASP